MSIMLEKERPGIYKQFKKKREKRGESRASKGKNTEREFRHSENNRRKKGGNVRGKISQLFRGPGGPNQ